MSNVLKIRNFNFVIVCLVLIANQAKAEVQEITDVTPSDVYHKVVMLNAELKIIRDELGVRKELREPILQINKLPVHVYAKSLEVFKKVSKLQNKHGLASNTMPVLRVEDIRPAHVLLVIDTIYSEVIRLKSELGISKPIKKIDYYSGRTPSNVYEKVWQASYLIDGMIKPIKLTEVYEATLRVQSELKLLANHLQTIVPDTAEPPQSGRSPKQVHLQSFINLHKFSHFEKKLKMKAFRVPSYPKTKITPSDVYDTTNIMLAELNRIKLHLGIKHITQVETVSGRKRPSHVLVQMNLINDQLEHLTSVVQ